MEALYRDRRMEVVGEAYAHGIHAALPDEGVHTIAQQTVPVRNRQAHPAVYLLDY
jgi:hypothetical protein